MNKKKWVYLKNLYFPPVSSEHPVKLDPSAVRILPNSTMVISTATANYGISRPNPVIEEKKLRTVLSPTTYQS